MTTACTSSGCGAKRHSGSRAAVLRCDAVLAPRYGWRDGLRNVELWYELPSGKMEKVVEANMEERSDKTLLANVGVGTKFE